MLAVVPPLTFFCISALAHFPDHLHHHHHRRIPPSPALLDALPRSPDARLWAVIAQLVHPLPPHLHDHDLPLSHPDLPLLQKIPRSPDFSLVTLVSLPNCVQLRDDSVADLRALHHLLALDLRGCSISSYAITTLARGLAATGTGPWGLRLLNLHGCPNIDDGALSALCKFPLLSAVDLRFTRCTPSAINTRLSSLGFRPSRHNSLFHPAPLSLALSTLEKIAHTASVPVSLYSCPSQSVFRVHIDGLNQPPTRPNQVVPVDGFSIPPTTIRTVSSAEDIVVFIPPPRRPTKNGSIPPFKPSESADAVHAIITSPPTDPRRLSNVASFYESAPAQSRRSRMSILPLSAQAVQSSKGNKLNPLAIARSPPPWRTLDTNSFLAASNSYGKVASPRGTSDNIENLRQKRPTSCWTGQALDNPLKVDRARLQKRGSDTVADMAHRFASKRLKVKSEFARAKTQQSASVKSRNPFARSIRSVFIESNSKSSGGPSAQGHESSKETGLHVPLRSCYSLPSEPGVTKTSKPLKPITTLKPPVLPKELLPSSCHSLKPRRKLKQMRLSFSCGGGAGEDELDRSRE